MLHNSAELMFAKGHQIVEDQQAILGWIVTRHRIQHHGKSPTMFVLIDICM